MKKPINEFVIQKFVDLVIKSAVEGKMRKVKKSVENNPELLKLVNDVEKSTDALINKLKQMNQEK